MRINPINYSEYNIKEKPTAYKNNTLSADVFQKNAVSFGSGDNNKENIFSSLFNNLFNTVTTTIIDSLADFRKYIEYEKKVSFYIDILSTKENKKRILSKLKTEKLETFNKKILNPEDEEYITDLLTSSGIKSLLQFHNFLNTFTNNPDTKKIFKDQSIEAIKIYGSLDNKNRAGISKFPEFLLYIYNEENEKENPDYSEINATAEFLLKIGLNNSKDFDNKFSYLKDKFNDFENIADKIEAVKYLRNTYEQKINILEKIINSNSSISGLNAETFYKNNYDIIDYLYENNNEKNLGDLEKYIDIIEKAPKLKPYVIENITNGDSNSPRDKIIFYSLIKECGIPPSLIKDMASRSIISDSDMLDNCINFKPISDVISKKYKIEEKDAQKIYINLKDVFNSVYKDEGADGLETALDVIQKFHIKNSNLLLQKYNELYVTKNKTIAQEELKNFIDLLSYADSSNVYTPAKKQNTTVLKLLTEEKGKTEALLKKIDKFIANDETGYFIDRTSTEIYREYKEQITQNPDDIPAFLKTIEDFNIANSEEYEKKMAKINSFAAFFPDKSALSEFFKNNHIRFDNSIESTNYREACIGILNTISDNSEKSKERIQYYTNTDFFKESKENLHNFISSSSNPKELFSIIADKKIPSLKILEKYFKKYQNENGERENLLKFIEALPDNIDFSASLNILNSIQNEINNYNLPFIINNDNILAIDTANYNPGQKLTSEQLNNLLIKMENITDSGNMITALPNALKGKQFYYSKYRIAQELINKLEVSSESYHNMEQMFKINKNDLNLDDEYSDYIYIKAAERNLPDEFVNFVNSNEWIKYSEDKTKIPYIPLHSRLRLIDRFALPYCKTTDDLYSAEIQDLLKDVVKAIYTKPPHKIYGTDQSKRIVINTSYGSSNIETVFSNNGEMVTCIKKNNN